jgi:hypothetical protein
MTDQELTVLPTLQVAADEVIEKLLQCKSRLGSTPVIL